MLKNLVALFLCARTVFASNTTDVYNTKEQEFLERSIIQKSGISGLVEYHGLEFKSYDVLTEDGWVLKLHRIRSPNIYDSKLSSPILIVPGIAASSFDFLNNPRNESPAFVLADHGFDVWFLNYRATIFSDRVFVNETIEKPKPERYFKSSWQSIAEYDIPAALDKILEETRQPKIHVIGHSMGGTSLFAFFATDNRYDDKVGLFEAIAPVIHFDRGTSGLLHLIVSARELIINLTVSMPKVFFGRPLFSVKGHAMSGIFDFVKDTICYNAPAVCVRMLDFTTDREVLDRLFRVSRHIRKNRAGIYGDVWPAGVTLMNLFNYAIEYDRVLWTKFDYRKYPQFGLTNQEQYGQEEPPLYDFSNVRKSNLHVTFVRNDLFMSRGTIAKSVAKAKIPRRKITLLKADKMTHFEAIVAWDSRCYIFNDIVGRLVKYETKRGIRKLIYYRQKVPKFVDSLPYDNGCTQRLKEFRKL